MYNFSRAAAGGLLVLACLPAASDARPRNDEDMAHRRSASTPRLERIQVKATARGLDPERFPGTVRQIDAAWIRTRVNAIDPEDSLKYLPSLMVRKRNIGDTQAVLATRTWGVNSSARSLIYVDGVLISALIANDNTAGGPRWGMIDTQDIDRVDVSYGPYSAAYPGNAIGAVVQIHTQIPAKPSITLSQTMGWQDYHQYATRGGYFSRRTAVTASRHWGRWSLRLGADSENSFSQPLSYLTALQAPAGTHGAIPSRNKLGQPVMILGAGGLLHTRSGHLDGRLDYDLGHGWSLGYLFGYWQNHGRSQVESYLHDAAGAATLGGVAGFASAHYWQSAGHLMQALRLSSDTQGDWDGSLVLSQYRYMHDLQSAPAGVQGDGWLGAGRVADSHGTGWMNLDMQGLWRPFGYLGGQELSAGLHLDRYRLSSPTYTSADWTAAGPALALYSLGQGQTRSQALWLQDRWSWTPAWELSLGGRWEHWQASDGRNALNGHLFDQPRARRQAFSPKAALQWHPNSHWSAHLALAGSTRFATVSELYQLVATGTTYTRPNPDLQPERVSSGELAASYRHHGGEIGLTLFQERTRHALIAQTQWLPNSAVPVTAVGNVDRIRNRGIELVLRQTQTPIKGLSLDASVTFVDSTIMSDPGFASATGQVATGHHVPYVPRWRATAVLSYQLQPDWSLSLAGRYSGRQYSTLDNSDVVQGVFGAFDSYTVFDLKASWQVARQLRLSAGIDNLGGRRYFLYHPFPMRSYMLNLEWKL